MTKTIQLPKQGRGVELRAGSFDADDNTVELVWTTGATVRRYSYRDGPYNETLDVTPKAVRMDRLNGGAPFLNTHSSYDLGDVIGSVVRDSAKIAGGKGTAKVKLSSDPAHAGIVGNIRDGVITNVSVGYLVHAVEKTEADDGSLPTWRVTDWEPIEISAVPIPADPGAQMRSGAPTGEPSLYPCSVVEVARAAPEASPAAVAARTGETAVNDRATLTQDPAAEAARAAAQPPAAPAAPDLEAIRAQAQTAERERSAGIRKVARQLRLPEDVVERAIEQGVSVVAFRELAIDEAERRQAPPAAPNPGASDPEGHRSYAQPRKELPKGTNATRALIALAACRGSSSEAAAFVTTKYGREADTVARALAASVGSAGGFLVPPDMSEEVIELLRPASVVMSLDPRILPMEKGQLMVPRVTGGATANYVGENQPIPASQPQFGMVQLSAKKLTAEVPISNDMIRFPTVATDSIVRDDMVKSIAVRGDLAFIRGNGSAFSPRGLRSYATAPSLNGQNLLTATPLVGTAYAASGGQATVIQALASVTGDLSRCELALEQANIPMTRPGWIMSPRSKQYLMNIRDGLGNYVFQAEMSRGMLRGKPFRTTTQVPNNLAAVDQNNNATFDGSEITLADFAEVYIGEAYGLIIDVFPGGTYVDSNGNTVSGISTDQTVMRAIVQHDMAMRQEAAVAVLTGARWY